MYEYEYMNEYTCRINRILRSEKSTYAKVQYNSTYFSLVLSSTVHGTEIVVCITTLSLIDDTTREISDAAPMEHGCDIRTVH